MKVTYLICGHCLHSLKLNVENESLLIFWFQISKGSAIPRKMSISSMKAHVEKIHPEVKVALSFYQGASKTSSLAGIRLAASALSIKNRETMLKDSAQPEFDLSEATSVLNALALTSVTLGDYLVVMNNQEDATISGEPYLALQLWLNMKSGKVINRIWSQTVAYANIANIDEFIEACTNHFRGRPCLGCPLGDEEQMVQGFVVSQTPIPRKISLECQKVLDAGRNANVRSCQECQKLIPPGGSKAILEFDEKYNIENQEIAETQLRVDSKPLHKSLDWEKQVEYDHLEQGSLSYPPEVHEIYPKSLQKSYVKRVDYNKTYNQEHKQEKAEYNRFYYKAKAVKRKRQFEDKPMDKVLDGEKEIDSTNLEQGPAVKMADRTSQKRKSTPSVIGPMDVRCELCGMIVSIGSYRPHYESHGQKFPNPVKKCAWCAQVVATNQMIRHAKKHHFWGRFSCTKCIFLGDFAPDLVGHLGKTHKEVVDAPCPSCKEYFPLKEIEDHYKKCVTQKFWDLKERSKTVNTVCETCGKFFKLKRSYEDHLKKHLREQAAGGDQSVDESNLYRDV